ncbi:MAG: TonB C-terminal domain-containing protein [Cyanobacteria bacterium HKST-UBA02]|nr:TonB C-terminal domain-containing protein [Cyanobacteria bacterium HKST-UBA02]
MKVREVRGKAFSKIAMAFLGILMSGGTYVCAEPKPPSEAILLNNKAFALEKTGKTSEAIDVMREIVRRFPQYTTGRMNLAIFLNNKALQCTRQGRSDEALHFLEESLFYSDNQASRDNLNSLLNWMKIDPTDRDKRLKLSKECIERGDRKAAIVHLRAAQAIKSDARTSADLKKLEAEEAKVPNMKAAPQSSSPMTAYREEVMLRLNASYFPVPSRESFRTEISFRINPDGSHTNPVVKKSSGLKARDDEVLRAISMAGPFRPFPAGEKEPLPVEYSFDYEGNRDKDKQSNKDANRKAIDLFIEAQKLSREGKQQEALAKFRAARECAVSRFVPLIDAHIVDTLVARASKKSDPGISEALLREALLLEPRMELASARLDQLLRARGVAPTDFRARMKLAEEFDHRREFGPARVEYNRTLELLDRPGPNQDPLTVNSLRGRVGEALDRLEKGQTREEDKWRRFLTTNPNSLEALLALARIVESHNRNEAIELLSRAEKLQPGNQTVKKELERLQGSRLEANDK